MIVERVSLRTPGMFAKILIKSSIFDGYILTLDNSDDDSFKFYSVRGYCFLGYSPEEFQKNTIQIYINGRLLEKGERVNFISGTMFQYYGPLDPGDVLMVFQ